MYVCVCVFESARRVVTYPWAAEGAGGEARGGSTNRPRPVAQTRKNTHRGRGNLWDQHVYLLHVSVNTGGGESLEVTCCTQLESTTADVTIVLSTVVAIKPFANTTPIHTKRAKALQHSNSTDLTTDITSIDSQQLVSN